MSEYQYVAFRAIDGPLSDQALAYMEKQSSRAEITPWAFDNEYHYGDFGGDSREMLRRGYDIYLHYANFGYRYLSIRLPNGFPDPQAASHYLDEDSISFAKDKKGAGGILAIEPFFESDDVDQIWDVDDVIDELIPLREEILSGDLRPLFIAYLGIQTDGNHDWDEPLRAPVPAGLKKPTDAQLALADYLGLSDALLAAAAKNSPKIPAAVDTSSQYKAWLDSQSEDKKTAWLLDVMSDADSTVRRDLLTEFQKEADAPAWPTAESAGQTVSQLMDEAKAIAEKEQAKAEAKAERERQKRLRKMAEDPDSVLQQTEKLVAERSTSSYNEAAKLLADLREVLIDTAQADLPAMHAKKLKEKNPTLKRLTSALRKQGLLPKK